MKFKIASISTFVLVAVLTAYGLTRVNSEAIWNSTIDNTPIGNTTTSSGKFTSLTSGSVATGTVASNSASVNASPSVSGNAGFTGWGKNGTGDFDFFAGNSGASPSFVWYFLLGGSTLTQEMILDQNANLKVLNGSVTANGVVSTSVVQPHVYTVATLPGAAISGIGAMVIVSDANGVTVGSTCVGGGSQV